MAKSKNGGSRAFVRGRIGSDVYSIGKDGKGARQQVVRSLAVQVANPRTQSQMVGRMIMSTIMQAVSAMRPIIDHSFDGIASGQPSISEFIRLNYQKAKTAYLANNINDEGGFVMNDYQEKGIHSGSYQISKGEVPAVGYPFYNPSLGGLGTLNFELAPLGESPSLTAKIIKDMWPVGQDDYLTMVALYGNATVERDFRYLRVKMNFDVADATVITADNVATLFEMEGNVQGDIYFKAPTSSAYGDLYVRILKDDEMDYTVNDGEQAGCIVSKKTADGWKHSTVNLNVGIDDCWDYKTYDAVLATYPLGSEQFLNGGGL